MFIMLDKIVMLKYNKYDIIKFKLRPIL